MAFIFQAKPSIYNLKKRLEVGKSVGWLASRYRDRMKRGDIVYFWSAGKERERGIYGWGIITSNGFFEDSKGMYRVAVTCQKIFRKHINVSQLRDNEILKDLQILHSAMGTNFILTDAEAHALRSFVASSLGGSWAPQNGETKS